MKLETDLSEINGAKKSIIASTNNKIPGISNNKNMYFLVGAVCWLLCLKKVSRLDPNRRNQIQKYIQIEANRSQVEENVLFQLTL